MLTCLLSAGALSLPATAYAQDSVKIGFVAALTGPAADLGRPTRDGALLFIEALNAAGGVNGKKIELIIFDDESNPARAVSGVRKMIDSDGVLAIASGTTTGATLATLKITQDQEIPHLVFLAQAPIVTRPLNLWTFRVSANFDDEIARIATFLKDSGAKRIGILKDSGTVGKEAILYLKPKLDALGIQIVSDENVTVNATDVTAQSLNIRRANPEAVVFYGYGPEAALFGKTMKQIGFNVPVIGNRGLAMPVFLDTGGPAVEGFVFTDNYTESRSESQDFAKKFKARFNYDPINAFPAIGYDAAGILAQAVKTAKTLDRKGLRDALEGISNFPAIAGGSGHSYSFTAQKHDGPTGSVESVVVIRQVKDGKYVDYKQ
jgi:branched-chain amino acid transport system substrate-binding protein